MNFHASSRFVSGYLHYAKTIYKTGQVKFNFSGKKAGIAVNAAQGESGPDPEHLEGVLIENFSTIDRRKVRITSQIRFLYFSTVILELLETW